MNARSLATTRILRAARRFPDVAFRVEDDAGDLAGLDPRDTALAGAIEHQALRRWLTLVAVLESQLSRPWVELEWPLQSALLCGAAQLLLLDRLPEYAVIDETVEWAKSNVRPKAGGLVNAVLRKVAALRGEHIPHQAGSPLPAARDEIPLHDGRRLRLKAPLFAEDAPTRLSQQSSHALELLEHWIGLFGAEKASRLAQHDLVHAPIIVRGVSADDAAAAELTPHAQSGYFVLDPRGHAPFAELLKKHPAAIVQDPTAAAAVEATRAIDPAPRLIIDACAGRGTKTRQLALTHPAAKIFASDVDRDRLRQLRAEFSGLDRVRVVEAGRLIDFAGQADLVLLDVPCSNSGVLARRVEAKYRFTRASLKSLIDVQRQIVADSLRLVAARGHIAYATCSIDPAENSQQAAWLAQWHPFEIVAQQAIEPTGLPGDPPATYRDGGYWALLRKQA